VRSNSARQASARGRRDRAPPAAARLQLPAGSLSRTQANDLPLQDVMPTIPAATAHRGHQRPSPPALTNEQRRPGRLQRHRRLVLHVDVSSARRVRCAAAWPASATSRVRPVRGRAATCPARMFLPNTTPKKAGRQGGIPPRTAPAAHTPLVSVRCLRAEYHHPSRLGRRHDPPRAARGPAPPVRPMRTGTLLLAAPRNPRHRRVLRRRERQLPGRGCAAPSCQHYRRSAFLGCTCGHRRENQKFHSGTFRPG
jgi:hypothetical protein